MDVKIRLRKRMIDEQRRRQATCPRVSRPLLRRLHRIADDLDVDIVAAFMPFDGEVDIKPFLHRVLAEEQTLWLPRFNHIWKRYDLATVSSFETDLVVGNFGIAEPVAGLPAVDHSERQGNTVLWLVPGLAFDAVGHRLGRGKGYYDRLLENTGGIRVGVCWEWQVVTRVPSEDHDVPMDWVVTDERTIRCNRTLHGENSPARRENNDGCKVGR